MGFRADGNTVISCRGIHTNCYGITASCLSRTTNGNRIVSTSIAGCIGIVANDDRVTSYSLRIFSITRTNDYRVLLSSQCMVIADDNIRLVGSFDWQDRVIIIAVAGKFIIGTDDIIMLAVNNLIAEAVDVVVLRRLFRVIIRDSCFRRCISNPFVCIVLYLITFDGISDTDNLAHIGTFDVIAAAHDHDLSAAFLDGILHKLSQCFWIVSVYINFYRINRYITIGVGNGVACANRNSCIGIRHIVDLADKAVGHTAGRPRLGSTLICIACTIGYSSRTTNINTK